TRIDTFLNFTASRSETLPVRPAEKQMSRNSCLPNRCASGLVCLIRIELKTTRFSYSPSTMRQRKPINCPAPFLVGPMLASSISAAYLPGGTSEKGCVPCSVSTSKASSSTVDRSDMGAPMFAQGGEVEVDRNGNLLWRAEPILGGEGGPSFEKEKA